MDLMVSKYRFDKERYDEQIKKLFYLIIFIFWRTENKYENCNL